MSDPAFQSMSVEDYLRTEQESPIKREYVGGFVYPLHGATRAHVGTSKAHMQIVRNFVARLDEASERMNCRLSAVDMKLRVEGVNSFFYPDVMVVCGQPGGDPYFETDPCLLVEVLSPGTESRDRREKYSAYTALPSLQTYLIVAQDARRVYAYTREGAGWTLQELVGQGEVFLPCLSHTLTLDQIYRGVPGL